MDQRPEDSKRAGNGEEEEPIFGFDEIPLERGAPRPATILKVADELEIRGGEILELFREVTSPSGQAVFPIQLRRGDREYFIEVETETWEPQVVESFLGRASVLRSSVNSEAELRILSAHTIPEEIEFFASRAPAALLQLDLIAGDLDRPEEFSELFRVSAGKRWGTELDYTVECLPLVEELLGAAFDAHENAGKPPVSNSLVEGLGCFLGEILRARVQGGEWRESEEWGESVALELGELSLDPIGKARAFMYEGAEDSISFYAKFVLEEIRRAQP